MEEFPPLTRKEVHALLKNKEEYNQLEAIPGWVHKEGILCKSDAEMSLYFAENELSEVETFCEVDKKIERLRHILSLPFQSKIEVEILTDELIEPGIKMLALVKRIEVLKEILSACQKSNT